MNSTRQFWSLLKFHAQINPFIWIFPVAFTLPMLIEFHRTADFHPSLGLLLTDYNQIMIVIMGSMVLLPDAFQFSAQNAATMGGTEFLVTRAVDRPLVFRARAVLFAFLVMSVPVVLSLIALASPDVQVGEWNHTLHDVILANLPGSSSPVTGAHDELKPILIPGGNLLVHTWHAGTYLLILFFSEAVIFIVQPLGGRARRWLFWMVVFGVGMAPILEPLSSLASAMHERVPYNEQFFFWYANHLALFWVMMLAAGVALQLWCERRFARMEF